VGAKKLTGDVKVNRGAKYPPACGTALTGGICKPKSRRLWALCKLRAKGRGGGGEGGLGRRQKISELLQTHLCQ